MIPFSESAIARETVDQQVKMFAMFVGPGLHVTRAALSAASKISTSTLRDLAGGSAMTVAQLLTLRRFLPGEAINMITEPGDAVIVDTETAKSSWFDLASVSAGLAAEICEAGKDGFDPGESARLRRRTRTLIAEAQHMVESG